MTTYLNSYFKTLHLIPGDGLTEVVYYLMNE